MRVGLSAAAVYFSLLAASITGCAGKIEEGPPTVPAKGKVEFTKGGKVQDLSDRSVMLEFQSIEQPEMKAFGAILEDGSFTMTTHIDGQGKPGVLPGMHRVRLNADESAVRFVAAKFLRYETSGITVKIPSDGDLIVKVWK